MSRRQQNSAFFNQKNQGSENLFGGDEPEEVKVSNAGDQGGTISAKGLVNAFKRAKETGAFIVNNGGLIDFPEELCDFANFKIEGENWWDGNVLTRVDLSNNLLSQISAGLAKQGTIVHLNFQQNKIHALPDEIYSLPLKVLDLANNQLTSISDAIGKASSLVELRLNNNQIDKLPEAIGQLEHLEVLDVKQNKIETVPQYFGSLKALTKLNMDQNKLTVISECFSYLTALKDLSLARNKIERIEGDALKPLRNLVMLDLNQNQLINELESIPESDKLDQIMLSFNYLTDVKNLDRCPNLTVLDLHNNKLEVLPEAALTLYQLKTLTISNNNLSDLNARLSLLDNLARLSLEGNPLRSIKPAMRTKGAAEIKKFLKMRLGDQEIMQEETKMAKALKVPGASKMGEEDPWDVLLREFVQGNQLDLKQKELKFISPKLWQGFTHITFLDLS